MTPKIIRLAQGLRGSRFVRAFGVVTAGTAAGQVVGLIAVPVLSRWYTPSAYGEFGVFTALAASLAAFVCLRLDLAVPRCESGREAGVIASAGIVSSLLFSIALTAIVLFSGTSMGGFGVGAAAVWMLPLSVLLGGAWLLLNQLAIRHGRFRAVALRAFVQPVVMLMVQVAWVWLGMSGPGLVYGYVAGQVAATALYVSDARAHLSFDWRESLASISAHRRYIALMTPQGVLSAINTQLPILMVSWLFSSASTGQFGMTQRVMGLPVGLIGTAMGQVYVSFLAERTHHAPGEVKELFGRVSKALGAAAAALVAVTIVAAPQLFRLILGPQWTEAGSLAQIMAGMYGAQLVAAPLSATLVVLRREVLQVAWDLGRLGVLAAIYAVSVVLKLPVAEFATGLSVALLAMYAVLWALAARTVDRFDSVGLGE